MITISRVPVRALRLIKRDSMASVRANLSLKIIKNEDIHSVQLFLKKFFYRDEPLNKVVKLWERENTIKNLEIYSTLPIKYNSSFMAVDDRNEIIGICLNKIRTRNEEDDTVFDDPIFSKIVGIMIKADDESKIFERFPDVDRYFQHDIISVDPNARGQGIAKALMDVSRELALKNGFTLLRVDCTSLYSAKAAARLGFEKIYTLKYEDHKDDDGNQVFKPESPHTEFTVYVKRLDGKSVVSKL